jgi:hypothetical protein
MLTPVSLSTWRIFWMLIVNTLSTIKCFWTYVDTLLWVTVSCCVSNCYLLRTKDCCTYSYVDTFSMYCYPKLGMKFIRSFQLHLVCYVCGSNSGNLLLNHWVLEVYTPREFYMNSTIHFLLLLLLLLDSEGVCFPVMPINYQITWCHIP